MSLGLQLLRAVIETNARTEFRQVDAYLFTPEEVPAFDFISAFYRRHGRMPTVEACAENNFLLPAATNPVGYYIERVRTRAVFNTIQQEQSDLRQAMLSRDMGRAVEVLQRMNFSVGRLRATQDVATMGELVQDVLLDYEAAHRHPGQQGVTMGWDYLDELTGGAEPGDVVTLVARPGMGKSWLMTHMARAAWRAGNSVLFVTMEMTNKQIARRFLGIEAGTNPDYIRRGQLSTFMRDTVYEAARDVETGAPFHLLSGSFDKSVPLVDAAVQEFSPDIVYIDASYLMSPSNKGGRRAQWELLSEVGKEIKQLALDRRKPVIQSVQFNREVKKAKEAGVEHIGGSDSVGQISTIAIAIGEGTAPHEQTRRKLSIMKNREGHGGEFEINFLFDPPSFDFAPFGEGEGPLDTNWMI